MVEVVAKRPFQGLEGAVKRGQRLDVSEARRKELGRLVEDVHDSSGQPADGPKPAPGPAADDDADGAKMAAAPDNKMEPAPANKAEPRRRSRKSEE